MGFASFKVDGEERVGAAVRIDEAWELVEKFSHLVRESGTGDEALAVEYIAGRLSEWGIHHTLHHPELLISLPRRASLKVGQSTYKAKTPSMAMSTPDAGVVADVVYEPTGFAKSVEV
jgi:N-acetylated-alpha-linked acidic dipeptidase